MNRSNEEQSNVMQRDNERGLVTVEDKRTDDGVCLKQGSVHLLMADTALDEQHRCRFYLAMCGAELTADTLPPWECPEGCECGYDALICPECVNRAAELSMDARPEPGAQPSSSSMHPGFGRDHEAATLSPAPPARHAENVTYTTDPRDLTPTGPSITTPTT